MLSTLLLSLARIKSKSQSQSYVTTDGQSTSLSWNKALIWGLRSHFYYCLTVADLLIWGALSDERTGLSLDRCLGFCLSYIATDGQSASLSWNKAPVHSLFITARQLGWKSPPWRFLFLVSMQIPCHKSVITKHAYRNIHYKSTEVPLFTALGMCLPGSGLSWFHSLMLWANPSQYSLMQWFHNRQIDLNVQEECPDERYLT
jgi:hypothetical protein